ncbi:MAG: DUF4175 family protein [Alphaproteobacteria bacterium]|nr:DUF4175 family protein [Alphaproteobacteria bacterium]
MTSNSLPKRCGSRSRAGRTGERLQQLLDQMAENGMPQNGELGRAGEEMGNARDSLGEGESGQALGQQGNALDALRQGAQGLAEQMLGQGRTRHGGAAGQSAGRRPARTSAPQRRPGFRRARSRPRRDRRAARPAHSGRAAQALFRAGPGR